MILDEGQDIETRKLRVPPKFSVLPARKAAPRADPKGAVSRGEECPDQIGREALVRRRLPGNRPDAVKAQNAELGCKPQIPVAGLRNAVDLAPGKTVAILPGSMGVLRDIQRGVQREGGAAACEEC